MERKNRKYIRVLWLLLTIITVVFGIILFVAPFSSNWSVVVNVRKAMFKYVGTSLPWFYYTLQPIEIRPGDVGGTYKYKWIGYLSKIDYTNNEITALDRWGRDWKFRFFTQASRQTGKRELMFNQQLIMTDGQNKMEVRYLTINNAVPEDPVGYFTEGEQIALFWGDLRTTDEIMTARLSGEVFELKGSGIIPIVRIIREDKR